MFIWEVMGDNAVVTNQVRFLMILFYSSDWVPPLHTQVLDNFLGQGSTKSHSLKEVFPSRLLSLPYIHGTLPGMLLSHTVSLPCIRTVNILCLIKVWNSREQGLFLGMASDLSPVKKHLWIFLKTVNPGPVEIEVPWGWNSGALYDFSKLPGWL